MTVIGVLSDTHIRDGDDVSIIERVAGQELGRASIILHAGDLVDLAPFESIFYDRPFHAVSGNMDGSMTRSSVPPTRRLHVEDAVIALAHGHGVARLPHDLVREFAGADAVVFGHTHRALCERRGGVLVLNPGSLLHPRGTSVGSVALLTVRGNRVDGEIIYCDGRERAS